jgi:hypothetical protein
MKIVFINVAEGPGGVSSNALIGLEQKHGKDNVLLINACELAQEYCHSSNKLISAEKQEEIVRIKKQIEDFKPEQLMLGVHGGLEDTTYCYTSVFGEDSGFQKLATPGELAKFFKEITSTSVTGKNNISLLMCYGARTNDYMADHSTLALDQFQTSFAHQFLKAYSSKNTANTYERQDSIITLEAFTGSVEVLNNEWQEGGQFKVSDETEIQLEMIRTRHNNDALNEPHLRRIEQLEEEKRLLQGGKTEKYEKYIEEKAFLKDPSELGKRWRKIDAARQITKLYESAMKVVRKQQPNNPIGVIDFTYNPQEASITCSRRYSNQPKIDTFLLKKFEDRIAKIVVGAYYNFGSKPRHHIFPVRPMESFKKELQTLRGDVLKTKILLDFEKSIVDINDLNELNDKITSFKNSEEYNILSKRQDLGFGKLASVAAFESICEDFKQRLIQNPSCIFNNG